MEKTVTITIRIESIRISDLEELLAEIEAITEDIEDKRVDTNLQDVRPIR